MKIAFYVSGNATRVKHIIKQSNAEINKTIQFVITDEKNDELEKLLSKNKIVYILATKEELKKINKDFSEYLYNNLRKMNIDYLFVFGKKLLKGEILEYYKNKMINFHPSILPLYSGFNAIDRAIKDGMLILGNTAHFIDDSIDAGPIIMQNILSVEVYKNEGYEGILKYQEEMFFKIYKLLKNKEIKIKDNKVVIKNGNYQNSFYIPE